MLRFVISAIVLLFFVHGYSQKHPKYELRGLWVATVKNIDWPSKAGLSSDEQKAEAIAIIEKAHSLNLNALFLQVRPSSDLIYPSELEPLTIYLTGDVNATSDYDPLKFWIDETHQRGMELHAWINPFRASMSINEPMNPLHPVKQHPDWFIAYAGKWQYDAGNPQCRNHIANVVKELVTRYNIDGVHMDDYFYPYPQANEVFNDSVSFNKYGKKNETLTNIDDWRRENVDKTIVLINQSIKEIKPYVEFGISPFGVWRNQADDARGSNTKAGVTNYDHLYADILKWMENDWVDYVVPQIYWDMNHPTANYKVLVDWWNKNSYDKDIYIGHALYRVNVDAGAWKKPDEIVNQIKYARTKANVFGSVHFSARHLNRDIFGLQDSLKNDVYKYPSLIPEMNMNQPVPVDLLPVKIRKCGRYLTWKLKDQSFVPARYIVYAYNELVSNPENDARNIYCITGDRKVEIINSKLKSKTSYFKVSAIDEYNRERCLSYPKRLTFKPRR
jgi:uncharacterized lipoprotein YddW (UPF0748 family)